jgi:hypothetical protein
MTSVKLMKGVFIMKKTLFVGPIVLLAILLSLNTVYAQMGPGMMGRGYGMGPGMMGQSGYGEVNCPYYGSSAGPGMMGPGMMGQGYGMGHHMMGPGYGRGPGMMGRGYGMGPGMMGRGGMMAPGMMGQGQGMGPGYGYGPRYQQPQKALEEKDVKPILENYLKSTRNPNLKLGKIEDKESTFEAEIMTKDDSLVDKIAVDKNTGWMRSIY